MAKSDSLVAKFLVQGSETDPYEVVITKTVSGISGSCTCAAGQFNRSCKHRMRILEADATGIVSGNAIEVKTVASWFQNSEIASDLNEMKKKEAELERLKIEIKKLKTSIENALKAS